MTRRMRHSAGALSAWGWLAGAALALLPCAPTRAEGPAPAGSEASKPPVRRTAPIERRMNRHASSPDASAPAPRRPTPPAAGGAPSAPSAARGTPKRAPPVVVPSTPHLRAELPVGLQSDLDADPRMQGWLDQTFAIIDQCHASTGRARGTLEGALTMHESARPELSLSSMPPALAQLVACASGELLRTRMPLFTGREGTRYPVRLIFQ